jgi:hypothetical protein
MRTETAQEGVDFAGQFNATFSTVTVGGDYPRTAVLRAPEGMSTGGGERARQALTLEALEHAGPAIALGWVDLKQYRASLRTYARLAEMHRERTDDLVLGLDKEAYDRFCELAQNFFWEYGLAVDLENYVGTPALASAHESSATPWRTIFIVAALGTSILIAVWRLFL